MKKKPEYIEEIGKMVGLPSGGAYYLTKIQLAKLCTIFSEEPIPIENMYKSLYFLRLEVARLFPFHYVSDTGMTPFKLDEVKKIWEALKELGYEC